MPNVSFSMSINAEEVQKYYRGEALNILATADNGLKVQFPANLILPHVTHQGVCGRFVLSYRDDGKAISLERV